MIEGKKNLTLAYQYLGESLLLYFIIYPVAAWSTASMPFWSYLISALVSLLVFQIGTHYFEGFLPYFLSPVLVLLLAYMTGVHFYLSLIIVFVFIWRFYIHEQEPDLENERFLLFSTTVCAFLMLILFNDNDLLAALLLQYLVVIAGYTASHYFQSEKLKRKSSLKNLFMLSALLAVGLALVIGLLPQIRYVLGTIWSAGSYLFLMLVNRFFTVLAWAGLEVSEIEPLERETSLEVNSSEKLFNKEENMQLLDSDSTEQVAQATESVVVFLLISGIILTLFLLNYIRKRKGVENEPDLEGVSYRYSSHSIDGSSKIPSFRFRRSETKGQIREHFLDFEKFAAKYGVGRAPNEPIEDWFNRVDLDVNSTNLYQQVRYGAKDLNEEEKQCFFKRINELKRQIKERNK
ncbi:hypothetical protein [Halobacillus litoralis]|uniref:DUF4129 domain-containing protein n=1 Tax=Halobacillus litoralis TaxID=45668 RepID=A0A410MGD9_9BACI|nr:hypothetical protein [Halobacillus litoralis]QAS53804.1 hypothetical protein HLI_17105 [Halobacillus litoralis]